MSGRTRPSPVRAGGIATALLCIAAWPAQARAGCIWSDLVRDDARAAIVKPGPP